MANENHFNEMIGQSEALRVVQEQVVYVAPTGATVLILGETGTGKELVARAIHRLSSRARNSFIKVNCAAIPSGLLESELFGHEKGAFTGAVSRKMGRLELANNGTLFLDEVGEIPLELQPKLLRVLQDHQFERLGSTQTIDVDVRLIAATNRDLARAVAEKNFRSDLFYRLNVFPIRTPALRDRRKDIPLLVRHFVEKSASRMQKTITVIPDQVMDGFVRRKWSGNIRELENFIERSVILSTGDALQVPENALAENADSEVEPDHTLQSIQRGQIIKVLRECGGLLSGPNGAAARLRVKRTTLQSKMQKLGISRSDYLT